MIKHILAFAAAAAVLASCASCVSVNFSASGSDTILGKGQMTTVEYPVGEYTEVEIDNEVQLYYTAAQSDKVVIELQENLAEHLDVSVKDGVLRIKSDKRFRCENGKSPKLYISTPTLEKLAVEGALSIEQADTIKADSFTLNVSGASNGDLSLDVNKLDVDISGACSYTFSGSAETAGFRASGASSIDASELKTKQASIVLSGGGSISVDCSDTLDIDVSGVGNVSYRGDPKITQRTSGAFSINRED